MEARMQGKRKKLALSVMMILAVTVALAHSQKRKAVNSGYHQIAKWDVGGEGFWDYLTYDSAGKRLFVSRGTHVMVLNSVTGTVVGDIPDTGGVHGIALAPELNKGFVSDGRDNAVTIFDLKTLKVLDKVNISPAANPDAILYEPSNRRVLTFNGHSKNVTVMDAKDGKVLGTIDVAGKPEFAVEDDGTVYVNDEDKGEIIVIDPKAMTVKSRWSLSTEKQKCEGPSGLAIDRKNHRLFSVCDDVMVVMNSKNGKVVTSLPTGKGTDAAGFDPETMLAFASNGDGTLTVVHENSPDSYSWVENVKTLPRARTMALDPDSHRVFLVTAQFGETPAKTAENQRPRPPMVPGTFTVLVFGK